MVFLERSISRLCPRHHLRDHLDLRRRRRRSITSRSRLRLLFSYGLRRLTCPLASSHRSTTFSTWAVIRWLSLTLLADLPRPLAFLSLWLPLLEHRLLRDMFQLSRLLATVTLLRCRLISPLFFAQTLCF